MLTDTQCRNATCLPDKRRARSSDAGGLYLEVSPTGSKRWFLKHRIAGVEKQLAQGRYPDVTLNAARKARGAAKLKGSDGLDPLAVRKIEKLKATQTGDDTFKTVALEWFGKQALQFEYWVDQISRCNISNKEVLHGKSTEVDSRQDRTTCNAFPGPPDNQSAAYQTGVLATHRRRNADRRSGTSCMHFAAIGAPDGFKKRGAPLTNLSQPSGRYLSFSEREEIAILHAPQLGAREIARRLDRSPSTISRELRRNAATRGGKLQYRATVAQRKAELSARRLKAAKLALNDQLRAYVQDRLGGTVLNKHGKAMPGPQVPWIGRRHSRRADRRWGQSWSSEQISQRLALDFLDDASMRISHEAIYQALYIQGRGALKRELTACLRTGRALRVAQARTRQRGRPFITPELMISERPAEVVDRAIPGHREGDLIIGLNYSAVGTLVERTTRFTMLLHLPLMPGHQTEAYVKNGSALAGRGAHAVRDAIALKISALPTHLSKSLTWNQGAEMAQHVQLQIETGLRIYFCDPRSPSQRGTNESTNGLLCQYFPNGTDMTRYGERDLDAVAATLNARPRKTLGWKTPAETFNTLISDAQLTGIATTP